MQKRKRRDEEKEAEEMLGKLLESGGRASTGGKYLAAIGRDRDKTNSKSKGNSKGKEEVEEEEEERKRPFSVGAIKKIGFDPTSKVGDRDAGDREKKVSGWQYMKALLTSMASAACDNCQLER
jgi:hypothetical protein